MRRFAMRFSGGRSFVLWGGIGREVIKGVKGVKGVKGGPTVFCGLVVRSGEGYREGGD